MGRKCIILPLLVVGFLLWSTASHWLIHAPELRVPGDYSGVIIEDLSKPDYSYQFMLPASIAQDLFNNCFAEEAPFANDSEPLFRFIFSTACGYAGENAACIHSDAELWILEIYTDGFFSRNSNTFYRCEDDIAATFSHLPGHDAIPVYYGEIYVLDRDSGALSVWNRTF